MKNSNINKTLPKPHSKAFLALKDLFEDLKYNVECIERCEDLNYQATYSYYNDLASKVAGKIREHCSGQSIEF